MKKTILAIMFVALTSVAAYAKQSVSCTANSNGTVSCTYTYTW